MGSSGSGSFSDYSRRKPTSPDAKNGGASGEDNCNQAFSASLEEVSRCFYFINTGTVPPIDTEVMVSFNGIRLVVETSLGEEVGYLPTKYNYVRVCIDSGFNYTGVVSGSSATPTPNVKVDIVPA
jgi:hypothetical protein